MREWIACRIATLKEWRKAKSKALWLKDGMEEQMPDTLLMSEQCLLDLTKQGEEFNEKDKLVDFLRPWLDLDEFVDEIFDCLQGSSPQSQDPPTKAQRKSILKAARASKKAKFMDDPTVAEVAQITALRDPWLLKKNKMNLDLKACSKKAKVAEQKQQAKLDKARQKA